MYKVSVVGSGYIGSVIASVLAAKGCDVTAIDVNSGLIAAFERGDCPIKEPGLAELIGNGRAARRLRFTADFTAIGEADVVLITVGTPLADDFSADLSHIKAAVAAVAPHVHDGQVIMVKSTVPPGVTRSEVAEVLGQRARVKVAFSPERLAEGSAIKELGSLPIVVGGVDQESTDAASRFWRETLGVDVIAVSSPEAAEMVKLACNLWIDLNIALAHDLARLCDALPFGVDVLEVISGANSLKKGQHYVNILTPSNGVGGYCLTKDPWFVHSLGKRTGLELLTPQTSRQVNSAMPAYCADQVARWAERTGRVPADVRIAMMGLSFKTNSGDIRLTPVLPLIEALNAHGFSQVTVHDPLVLESEASEAGFELQPSFERTLEGADCAVFVVGHDAFRAATPERLAQLLRPGALVFDGRMYFDREAIGAMRAAGLEYQGVGR